MINLMLVRTVQVREERGYDVPAIAVEMLFESAKDKDDEIRVMFNEQTEEVIEIIKNGVENVSESAFLCYREFVKIAQREWDKHNKATEEETLSLENALDIAFI